MSAMVAVYIFIAIIIGYFIGRYKDKLFILLDNIKSLLMDGNVQEIKPLEKSASPHLFQNLTQLLNEQPDTAIDSFIASVDVSNETLDVHFALGSLLRKRGETARALLVHQNVLQSSSLAKKDKHRAQLHLAIDYLSAGVFDRAEILFKELIDTHGIGKKLLHNCLRYLIELYESTKDWKLAIDIADQLTDAKFSNEADRWRQRQAHYCCELAELAKNKKDYSQARLWVSSAKRYDSFSIRASLIEAEIEISLNNYSKAINTVIHASESTSYIYESLKIRYLCHTFLKTLDTFKDDLISYHARKPHLVYIHYLIMCCNDELEVSFKNFDLIDELTQLDEPHEIKDLIDVFLAINPKGDFKKSKIFIDYLSKIIENYLHYECRHCGFTGKELHWSCPSCRSWGSVKLRGV